MDLNLPGWRLWYFDKRGNREADKAKAMILNDSAIFTEAA
jgi:hypothetical protein